MRIFLSPLFFYQSSCKHCVRIYYRENPDGWLWQYEVERMPPLGVFESGHGFVPDFPVLTMFDEFVIDGQAYERILSKTSATWLGPWPEVIKLLEAEGALSTLDVEEEVKQTASIRGKMLRRDMRDPARWADAMAYYDVLLASADKAFGFKHTTAETLTWEFDPDKEPLIRGSDNQGHILSAAPLTAPGEDPNDPHFQLHQAALDHLRMQLREVNAGLAVAARLNLAPMFWAPYKVYLEEKSDTSKTAANVHERAEAARLFFTIAFPRFKPDTVRELSRLRRDRRIRQLREVIISTVRGGDVIDPQYPQRVLEQVFRLERRIGRIRQIAGWISSAIGSIPLPGLGIMSTVASELVTLGVEHWLREDWKWFYLISDGTGHS